MHTRDAAVPLVDTVFVEFKNAAAVLVDQVYELAGIDCQRLGPFKMFVVGIVR